MEIETWGHGSPRAAATILDPGATRAAIGPVSHCRAGFLDKGGIWMGRIGGRGWWDFGRRGRGWVMDSLPKHGICVGQEFDVTGCFWDGLEVSKYGLESGHKIYWKRRVCLVQEALLPRSSIPYPSFLQVFPLSTKPLFSPHPLRDHPLSKSRATRPQ